MRDLWVLCSAFRSNRSSVSGSSGALGNLRRGIKITVMVIESRNIYHHSFTNICISEVCSPGPDSYSMSRTFEKLLAFSAKSQFPCHFCPCWLLILRRLLRASVDVAQFRSQSLRGVRDHRQVIGCKRVQFLNHDPCHGDRHGDRALSHGH